MTMPAPHAEALAWKLERIITFDDGGGYTPGWSRDYAGPALDDARRLAGRG